MERGGGGGGDGGRVIGREGDWKGGGWEGGGRGERDPETDGR